MHQLAWRKIVGLLGLAVLLGGIWLGAEVFRRNVNLPRIDRQNLPQGEETVTNTTGLPLTLPEQFSIQTFATDLARPRVLAFDSQGTLLVSDQKAGAVYALPDAGHDGVADTRVTVAEQLSNPHGLFFVNQTGLLIAEEGRLGRWLYNSIAHTAAFDDKIASLPTNGSHVTRTIQQGQDGRIYVSIGSSCNVCHETDERRAGMMRLNPDGTGLERWAWGLRNTVFFIQNPQKPDEFWGNEMGRDLLGDELPPDELNIIPTMGNPPGDYGWPKCYGANIHDTQFDSSIYKKNPCQEPSEHGSWYDYPAHHAPLGLRFIPEKAGWPKEWEGDLLVSWHGSWNRSEKAGYKVVRLELDDQQKVVAVHDFLTGFLQDDGQVIGRPVDLLFAGDGSLYISDDGAGRIFRVSPINR